MPKTAYYPVICSWCGAEIGRGPVPHSHGICTPCAKKWSEEWATERGRKRANKIVPTGGKKNG